MHLLLAPLIAVSTPTAAPPRERPPITYSFGYEKTGGRATVGARGGLAEGKPLQVSLWGGAGAVIGSLAGPAGTAIGAAAGAGAGLLYSLFAAPRAGPRPPPDPYVIP